MNNEEKLMNFISMEVYNRGYNSKISEDNLNITPQDSQGMV